MKKFRHLILTLCLVCAFALTPTAVIAFAGSVQSNINNESFSEGISSTSWYVTDDVKQASGNGKIVFDAEKSTKASRIVSNNIIDNMKKETMLSANITMKINKLPTDAKFGISLGLRYANSFIETKESSFIYFSTTNGSNLFVNVANYKKDRVEDLVCKSQTSVALVGNDIKLVFEVKSNGTFTLFVNETQIEHDATATINAEGYMGFGQNSKGCAVEISSVEAFAERNETPNNTSFIETFDNLEFNASNLYTRARPNSIWDAALVLDNNRLIFDKITNGYVTTKHHYSNLEYSFDFMPDRVNSFDEKGNRTNMVSAGFSVYFGIEKHKILENTTIQSNLDVAEQKLLDANGVIEVKFDREAGSLLNNKVSSFIEINGEGLTKKIELPKNLNIFDEQTAKGRSVTVSIIMLDGKLSVYLGFAGDLGLNKVCEQNFANTPLGYVWLRANGSISELGFSSLCNMWVDNLAVTNLDKNGVIKENTFVTNIWDTSDFEYVDSWK